MNIWQEKATLLTKWKGFLPDDRKTEIYMRACAYLMQKYEQADAELFNQFDGMTRIVWTTNKADIPCENALGCAELGATGGVYSYFWDKPQYDFFIMSMELAHRCLAEYYVEKRYSHPYERANDDVHYAANVMQLPYCSYRDVGFKIIKDWLLFRRATIVPIFTYDVRYLIDQTDRIRAEIQSGHAPSGVNEYWAGQPDSPAKEEILQWLGTYHTPQHHH